MGQTLIAYLPFVLIFFVMYFFLIRPQNKKQNEHKEMLESLKKGDKIITRGGIVAKIIEIQGYVFSNLDILNPESIFPN